LHIVNRKIKTLETRAFICYVVSCTLAPEAVILKRVKIDTIRILPDELQTSALSALFRQPRPFSDGRTYTAANFVIGIYPPPPPPPPPPNCARFKLTKNLAGTIFPTIKLFFDGDVRAFLRPVDKRGDLCPL
jgi:hypothetical protein